MIDMPQPRRPMKIVPREAPRRRVDPVVALCHAGIALGAIAAIGHFLNLGAHL